MPTTKQDIRGWLGRAKPEHTHMMVVCDTFEYDDYPVFVSLNEDIHERFRHYSAGDNMQRVMEVYNLSMDLEEQLHATRAFNF